MKSDATSLPWRALWAGWCTVMLSIGLSRFAYSPVLPELVLAHWFTPTDGAYFGAANLGGYLVGAVVGRPLANRLPLIALLRVMMLLATATFFACSWPVSFSWYFAWRTISGLTGGILMVLGPATSVQVVPEKHAGLASGVIFSGIGLGIIASGTLVPALLTMGLRATWWGLGLLALFVTLLGWFGWPETSRAAPASRPAGERRRSAPAALRDLYLAYALSAAGLVPAMLFLADYVARDLHEGVSRASHVWIIFGVGATVGSVLAGTVADRIGFRPALRGAFLLYAACSMALFLTSSMLIVVVTGFLLGALVPGIVSLVVGRLQQLAPKELDLAAWQTAWSTATVAFALGQTVASFAFSYLFGFTGSHRILFLVGAAMMMAALLAERMSERWENRTRL